MERRRRHERPQAGNPYKLTVNQHFHSKACIRRFANDRSVVAVLRRGKTSAFLVRPDNQIFCAKRVWSQQVERAFRRIESAFQDECDSICHALTVHNHQAVSEYLSIWQIRASLAEQRPDDIDLAGVDLQQRLTQDQEELLEQSGTFIFGHPKDVEAFSLMIPGQGAISPGNR